VKRVLEIERVSEILRVCFAQVTRFPIEREENMFQANVYKVPPKLISSHPYRIVKSIS